MDNIRQMTLLHVEDEPEIRLALGQYLGSICKICHSADNGEEGLELFREHRPDIVITDIRMPRMNGLELAKAIKEIDPNVPIIVTTAFTDTDYFIDAITTRIDRYIIKPINLKTLRSHVDQLAGQILRERELISKRKLLQEYTKAIDAGMSVLRLAPDFTIRSANGHFARSFGFEPEFIIGKPYTVLLHEEQTLGAEEQMIEAAHSYQIWRGVLKNRSCNGQLCHVDTTLVPIVNAAGELEEIFLFEHNISSIIETYRNALHTIYDADRDMVLILRKNATLFFANQPFRQFFQDTALPLISGQICLHQFFAESTNLFADQPERTAALKSFITGLIEADPNPDRVTLTDARTGEQRIFALTGFFLMDAYLSDQPLTILRMADITDTELLLHREMENMKLASIGKLSAGITHEINTPLTFIKGNLELLELELDSLPEETKAGIAQQMDGIREGANRIFNIVESMREIAGAKQNISEETNLFSTIIFACRLIYNRSKHIAGITVNGVPFRPDIDPAQQEFIIQASPQQVEQLWIILLNNALDAFLESPIEFEDRRIGIGIEKSGERYIVTVADNAGGIDPRNIDRLFDSFFSTKTHGSMGLGLSIARSLVEKFQGTISVENRDGGACFQIMFHAR